MAWGTHLRYVGAMGARLRALVLVGFALFAFGGPFLRQVVGLEIPIFRRWRMYSGYAANQCVGEFYRLVDGQRVPIDRLKLLRDVDHWSALPIEERRMHRVHVDWNGRELCRAGGFPDVRAEVKCASWVRWDVVHDGSVNLCETQP